MDRYEAVRDIGSGNFGIARLMRDKKTKQLVAIKYIERGPKIDQNVQREIVNHRSLQHPNIVRFKEVFLTDTHLGIVMEYAAGGELFERICNSENGRFSENEARYFFQQLISGVSYCHAMQICHRDLKLENTLLDGSPAPRLKICDFGYSKSALLHSQPKSTVGTPAYIAPEVLSRKAYDGKMADVWSCGVTLYVMLVGAYPFEDPSDPRNFRRAIERIMNVEYSIPSYVRISRECRHLLSCIFVANPAKRIHISDIMRHPWFLRNLPRDLILGSDPINHNACAAVISTYREGANEAAPCDRMEVRGETPMNEATTHESDFFDGWRQQSLEEVNRIVSEARMVPAKGDLPTEEGVMQEALDRLDKLEFCDADIESSGEIICYRKPTHHDS